MSKGKGNRNGRKGKRKGETEGKGNNANAECLWALNALVTRALPQAVVKAIYTSFQ